LCLWCEWIGRSRENGIDAPEKNAYVLRKQEQGNTRLITYEVFARQWVGRPPWYKCQRSIEHIRALCSASVYSEHFSIVELPNLLDSVPT